MWKKLQHITLISIIVCNVLSTSVVYAVTPSSNGNTTQENASLDPFTDSMKETSGGENEQITSTSSKDMSDETESTETSATNKPSESTVDESKATTEETITKEKEPEVEKVPTEKNESKEAKESLTPEEQGYEFIANPQKMSVATTQIENLYELLTVKKDGVLLSEDDYSLTLVEPFKKLNYYNETSYVKVNVYLNKENIDKEVSVPITATSGETLALTAMDKVYDMGITLIQEGDKTWLRSSNFVKSNGQKLHSGLGNQGVVDYYTLEIYNKDEAPYRITRKTTDTAGSAVQSFKEQTVEEDTVIHIQYSDKETSNRLYYFQNGNDPQLTKHSGYYKIVDGKFREIAPLIEFEMPTKLKYTKESMSNQEIEKLVKDNISMKTGDVKELSFNYKKYPDTSLGQDTARIEVKWEISPGFILTDEFEVNFYKYDLIPQNQKVPVGTVKLTNLEDFVKIQTPTTTLSKDKYTVKLIDNVTIETFKHYGNKSIQVEVTVKADGFKQNITVPFTVLKGETLELLGKPGSPTKVDGGLSLIQEDEGLMLRASDFSTDGNGSKLDDRYGTNSYHLIKIYKPDGTLQYELSRKGNDTVGELYKKFEPQNVEEGTIISLKEANADKIIYWHDENMVSSKSPVAGRDTDYYIVQNNTFKKVTSTVPTIKEVPEEIVYPKPNMTHTEIKNLIESKITVQAGSVKDLNLTYLKIPDTSRQDKDDTAIVEIKTEISPGNFISDKYTIRFTFYDIKTLSKDIPVTTRKVENLERQIEVETGRGSPEFSASVEGKIDPYYFNQINTTKNLGVRVHVENTGYERVVQVPFKIIAGQSMSFTGSSFRTDMGLSLIEEDKKLFLRASDFTDNGNNNVIHSGVGNNPHYRVNVHDSDGYINYEWLRKGSDKIQDGYKKFGGDEKQIEVEEGTVISMWRTEWHTLNYWDNSSKSVRHDWIDGREKQEFYVVENNKFRRVMNVLPTYSVPETAEYPKQNMSHKEIESFIKKQIIMTNGQVENLTIDMTKYPDTSDITKDDTAEFDISFEIEPGKTVRYKHKMLFQYYTISTKQREVPVGTQFNQLTDLESLVSITKNGQKQPFEMTILDQPDQYYFNTNGAVNNLRIKISLQDVEYTQEKTIPLKIVAGQTFQMQGYSYWTDMGFSLLEENGELLIRASDFYNNNNSGKLHKSVYGTHYELNFYDSYLAEDPYYTFTRNGQDKIQDGYKKFIPQKVDQDTIIGIYRVENHTINYWDNSTNSVRHNWIDGRKNDYYRIENNRFVRMTTPQIPTLNDVTTLSNKVTGQAEPNTKIYVRVDGIEIASGFTDKAGKFEIPVLRQKAGTKISAQAENKVGRSQLADAIVIQDVPAKPIVNPIFDNDKKVTGTGDAGEQITVAIGNKVLGKRTIKENGEFDIPIEEQLAGIKLSVYSSNSKGSSEIQEVEVQLTAPGKAEVMEFTDRDTEIKGTGKPGSEVEIMIGSHVFTGTVNRKKEFSIPVPMQEAGTEISVKLKNKAGESPKVISKVLLTKPDAPIVLPVESQATSVKGQAKKGATIKVYSGETLIGESKTSKEGSFDIAISPQPYGTELKVIASNAAGESDPTSVIVGLVPPTAPFVNEITDNDSKVTGKGTPGAEVLIYRGDILIGQGNVGVDGTFSVSIPIQKVGTTLNIYLKNTIGMSQPTEQKVILGKPLEMSVNEVTDLDDSISGTGKENATVQVIKDKKVIAEGKASDDGSFTLEIPIQKAGTILKLQQQNEAGKGPVAEAIVLLTAPKKPKVNQVTDRDTDLTGQGKAQTETIVTNLDGEVIGKSTSDENGEFTISIPIQKAYTILLITQKNAKGVSLPATIMVAHVSSVNNTTTSKLLSYLTNALVPLTETSNQAQSITILDQNIQSSRLIKIPPKQVNEEFIDLEQIEEEAQHIASKLPKENNIPGKKAQEKTEKDYLLPTTLSAGVSLAGLCSFLIYTVYIDKRHRDQRLFKDKNRFDKK